MSIRIHEYCDVCEKKIKSDEPVIQLKTGVSRSKGILRTYLGIFDLGKNTAIGLVHVDCIEGIEYNHENPNITLKKISEHISRGV